MSNRADRQGSTRAAQTTYLVEACASVNFAGTTAREQVILEMVIVDGQSQSDVARELAVSHQCVNKAIGRALAKLREANPERPPASAIDSHTGPASALVQVIVEGRTAPATGKRRYDGAALDQWELVALAGRNTRRLESDDYEAFVKDRKKPRLRHDWAKTPEGRRQHADEARHAREVAGTRTSTLPVETTITTEDTT
jgi:hypothetical protein